LNKGTYFQGVVGYILEGVSYAIIMQHLQVSAKLLRIFRYDRFAVFRHLFFAYLRDVQVDFSNIFALCQVFTGSSNFD
jgi:hypothetical protein